MKIRKLFLIFLIFLCFAKHAVADDHELTEEEIIEMEQVENVVYISSIGAIAFQIPLAIIEKNPSVITSTIFNGINIALLTVWKIYKRYNLQQEQNNIDLESGHLS